MAESKIIVIFPDPLQFMILLQSFSEDRSKLRTKGFRFGIQILLKYNSSHMATTPKGTDTRRRERVQIWE